MFHSLMVPLDQSPFAERALPVALSIARRAHAHLDLVEVHGLYALSDAHACWLPFEHDRDAECRQQEQCYLDAIAKRVSTQAAVQATTGVLSGSVVLPHTVADSLLKRARLDNADLIVMATHGRGPLVRLGRGSVTNELIRRAPMPVLLVRLGEQAPEPAGEPVLDNVLIPLDGSPLAEQVLGPAGDLACLMGGRCRLLRVIESRSFLGGHRPCGSAEKEQAEAYLGGVAGRLREQGVEVTTRVIVARSAAEAILQDAEAQGTNLIAVATHGRGGFRRLLLGSVADQLIRGAASPVLVYCATDRQA